MSDLWACLLSSDIAGRDALGLRRGGQIILLAGFAHGYKFPPPEHDLSLFAPIDDVLVADCHVQVPRIEHAEVQKNDA